MGPWPRCGAVIHYTRLCHGGEEARRPPHALCNESLTLASKTRGAGLVTVTKIGVQKHYQANRSSPIFEELHRIAIKTFGVADVIRRHLDPLAALRRHGYRSENRFIVFQCLQHTERFGPEAWRIFSLCHDRRNRAEHEGQVDISKQLVDDLAHLCSSAKLIEFGDGRFEQGVLYCVQEVRQ